ncbi:MAG: polyphosphate kinase 2 family protein, partial [Gillisia sp.]
VTRVHPEYVLKENLPHINKVSDITPEFWEKRFREIRHFEKTLAENGTIIFKFFMNISKEEQRHRLLRRLNKPDKNWKFSPDDLQERNLWNKYRDCYQDAINNTSEEWAPWYTIPSDDKVTSRYLVTKILHEDLQKKYPDVKEPELAPEIKKHLDEYKEELRKEK